MTAEDKLNATIRLYCSAKNLKVAALRAKYPNLSEEKIKNKAYYQFLYARD